MVALGIAAILRLYESRRTGGATAILAFAYLGFALSLTQSRTGWLYVVLLAVAYLLAKRRARLRGSTLAVGLCVAAFLALVIAGDFLNQAVAVSAGPALADRVGSGANLRLVHWQVIWDAMLTKPLLGYGWGQVALAQQVAVLAHPYTGEALSNSHNVALDLCVWNGFPIAALILGALLVWIVRNVWMCRDPERFCLLIAIGAVGLHGMFEYPLNYSYFLLPIGILMGAVDGMDTKAVGFKVQRSVFAGCAAALIGLGGWIAVEYLEVESAARVLRFVGAGIGVDKVAVAPEPEVVLLDRPRQFHRFMLTRPKRGMTPAELAWAVRISNMHPFASSLYRQSVILAINGQADQATTTLKRLCWTQPRSACSSAREGWRTDSEEFPELRSVDFPGVRLPKVSGSAE